MEINKEEAAKALAQMDAAGESAKALSLYKGADILYLLWGFVWIGAFSCQHFLPENFTIILYRWDENHVWNVVGNGMLWPVFILMGIAGTWWIALKSPGVVSPKLRWIGPFWGALYGFIFLWGWMSLWMLDGRIANSPEGGRYFTAIMTTIPMFAYVVMGMAGCGRYMIWLGLGVTAFTVLGLVLAGSWFYLWMAIFGGGALFATGIVVSGKWRQACSS